jgi:hypothetical protein
MRKEYVKNGVGVGPYDLNPWHCHPRNCKKLSRRYVRRIRAEY